MNGGSQKGIMIVLGMVACGSILGAVLSATNAVSIIGFGSTICTALIAILLQIQASIKLDAVSAQHMEVAKIQDVKLNAVAGKIEAVRAQTDGLSTALVAAVKETAAIKLVAAVGAASAAGALAGKAEEKAEQEQNKKEGV